MQSTRLMYQRVKIIDVCQRIVLTCTGNTLHCNMMAIAALSRIAILYACRSYACMLYDALCMFIYYNYMVTGLVIITKWLGIRLLQVICFGLLVTKSGMQIHLLGLHSTFISM